MANEAFGEGVEPGGLRDTNEIKILICYLLKTVDKPLSFDSLNEILQHDGLVNYFDFARCLNELLVSGHIDIVSGNGDGDTAYKCTRLGAGTAAMFERRLPFSIREKAVRAATKLLARIKREEENKVEITELPNGGFNVGCRVLDNGDTLLEINLFVPGDAQAEAVKKQFLGDPGTIYRGVLALLTGDAAEAAALIKNAGKNG